ncbi:hypothetical protein LOY38_11450 [Pseudomonas sp. B21-015]|uniref:hypothetical protein n=1 Tax=Pseudomonas sp. B21-015 TaxID=2895473 RepID=UPI00215FAAFD|nr:hypothetical protein [Pseudomonas sp. B21-015]UVM52598.1 hypothetical protein LOY38_11450 [Pseudomonas sp. B21-015]
MDKNGYNEFEFDLTLNDISTVAISQFNFHDTIDLTIERNSTQYDVKIKTPDTCRATYQAQGIFISNIKAYHNDGST